MSVGTFHGLFYHSLYFPKSEIFFSSLQKLFYYCPLENPINIGCVASAHRNWLFPLKLFSSKLFIAPKPITEQKDIQNIDEGSKAASHGISASVGSSNYSCCQCL